MSCILQVYTLHITINKKSMEKLEGSGRLSQQPTALVFRISLVYTNNVHIIDIAYAMYMQSKVYVYTI